jgi:S1-C subfamily serine protease
MRAFIAAACAVFCLVTQSQAQERSADPGAIARSVVRVVLIGPDGQARSSGSGTIISADGLIVTNKHVVTYRPEPNAAEAVIGESFAIQMVDTPRERPQRRYYARVVRVSEDFDFALLQIHRDRRNRPLREGDLNLTPIPLAQTPVSEGDRIRVFGFPSIGSGFMLITDGIVSQIENGVVGGVRMPIMNRVDAQIAPGNSGGLAVNEAGELVGVPTWVRSEQRTLGRISGMLPAELVALLIDGDQRLTGDIIPASTADGSGLDPNLPPNFGAVQLSSGVHIVEDIISGGDQDVSDLNYGEGCVGFTTRQPDYRVEFDAEEGRLHITFESDSDTALVVNYMANATTQRWACNDDGGGGHNPSLTLERRPPRGGPAPGRYAIWVAGVEDRHFDRGVLRITATSVQRPAAENQTDQQQPAEAATAP